MHDAYVYVIAENAAHRRLFQFTIILRYPPRSEQAGLRPTSFTAILRSHILSVRSPQPRYVVRGTTGTYIKTGLDVQEQQLRAYTDPEDIGKDPGYGVEPEALWGTLENLLSASGEGEVVGSTYVPFIHHERATGWRDVMGFLNLNGSALNICI